MNKLTALIAIAILLVAASASTDQQPTLHHFVIDLTGRLSAEVKVPRGFVLTDVIESSSVLSQAGDIVAYDGDIETLLLPQDSNGASRPQLSLTSGIRLPDPAVVGVKTVLRIYNPGQGPSRVTVTGYAD